ncbi:DBH-like monooxygenase protein 2 homolog isoform X1 [Gadus chalcogrammus]|uniref:DBH-like monooxygenase protein 2 homolog isoform X1 n=2 Tax=Gadus chalcogrammus TaxID=1042646 RepID=UPI0024C4B5F7|nr:DBH-like monooxygenase protein 2 homolog isoform X1 [Gadus chalcogrammus]
MKGSVRMWPQLALLYLLTAGPTWSSAALVDLPFMEYLDSNQLVLLQWGFDEVVGNITFTLSIKTSGWIGFGLSPKGNMRGADMVIGSFGTSGFYFQDHHATGNVLPMVDSTQDYVLRSITEVEGRTSMTFSRAIQTCDEEDFHITAVPIKLIYAYGQTDEIKYHGINRGTKEVNLLRYITRNTSQEGEHFDFKMDNITVPANITYYHCRVMKMPLFNVTQHVYRIEPRIDNLDMVHHMILYGCPLRVTDDYDGPCYAGNNADNCIKVMAVWGVGAGAYELPADAGIPIGGPNKDTLYRLETHYNNPATVAGRQDSSGLRIRHTSNLRRYNVGTLTTGVVPSPAYRIPPGATQFHAYGTCNTSLFSELMEDPVPDLKVFALLLHTHLAGRKIRAGLFRDGRQVDFLALDENYDFAMQEAISVGSIKTIKPNDTILVECNYMTTNRSGYTHMGLGTMDEMCLAFLLYYPEIPINSCWSTPDQRNIDSVPNELQPADQEDIIAYENQLSSSPQYQIVSRNEGQPSMHSEATVLTMNATPTVTCRNLPSPSKGGRCSCSEIIGGSALLLLLLWSEV